MHAGGRGESVREWWRYSVPEMEYPERSKAARYPGGWPNSSQSPSRPWFTMSTTSAWLFHRFAPSVSISSNYSHPSPFCLRWHNYTWSQGAVVRFAHYELFHHIGIEWSKDRGGGPTIFTSLERRYPKLCSESMEPGRYWDVVRIVPVTGEVLN